MDRVRGLLCEKAYLLARERSPAHLVAFPRPASLGGGAVGSPLHREGEPRPGSVRGLRGRAVAGPWPLWVGNNRAGSPVSGERLQPGPARATSLLQARLTSSKLLDFDPRWEACSPPVLANLYAFALPSNPATAQDLLKVEWTSQNHAPATAVSRDGFWPPLRIRVKLGRACICHTSSDTNLDSSGPETASRNLLDFSFGKLPLFLSHLHHLGYNPIQDFPHLQAFFMESSSCFLIPGYQFVWL
nr:unnamed protein product [Pongo abelii]